MSTMNVPDINHVMNDTRPSPFFAALPHLCITVNANRRIEKNRVGLGTRLPTPLAHLHPNTSHTSLAHLHPWHISYTSPQHTYTPGTALAHLHPWPTYTPGTPTPWHKHMNLLLWGLCKIQTAGSPKNASQKRNGRLW